VQTETPTPERDLATSELLRHAIAEVKLLARAEILHARLEMKRELRLGMRAGILLGVAVTLGLCGLALLFVTLALALPMAAWGGALVVGLGLLIIAAITGAIGAKLLPKKPMERTRSRLMEDVNLTKERLQ